MENECEALPGVAYPGVRDNRSTINTKTGYDDDDDDVAPSASVDMILTELKLKITVVVFTVIDINRFHFQCKIWTAGVSSTTSSLSRMGS